MKIDFQTPSANQNVDVDKTSKSTASSAGRQTQKAGIK